MEKNSRFIKSVKNGGFEDFSDSMNDMFETRGSVGSMVKLYDNTLLTNNESMLTSLWNKRGILRTYVELPVDDALKGGIEITSDNLDDESHSKLEEEFLKYIPALKEAMYWARLYGGAGLVVLNNGLELKEPLTLNGKVKDIDFLAVDRWRLGAKQGFKDADINLLYGNNALSYFQGSDKVNVNGKSVDNSRVILLRGDYAPLLTRQRVNGWGLSVLEKVAPNYDTYEMVQNLVYELMKEGKTSIFKFKDLMNSLASGEFEHIIQWIRKSNNLKKQIQTLVMDSGDDYQAVQPNLTGFADVLKTIRQGVCADFRMPMTKLFGLSASGFNSGEDDIDNYNSMIESTIRPELRNCINKMLEVICVSQFGVLAKGLRFSFKNLQELSAVEEENVKTSKWNRYLSQYQAGLISDVELKQVMEKEGL